MTTNMFPNFGQTLGQGVPGRENDRDGKTREVFLSDGMTVKLESRDPYGHWYIVWGKGFTPDVLSGSFTGPEYAMRALQLYMNNEKYNTKIVDTPVVKPELQYKKVKVA